MNNSLFTTLRSFAAAAGLALLLWPMSQTPVSAQTQTPAPSPRPDVQAIDIAGNEQRNLFHNNYTNRQEGYHLRFPYAKLAEEMTKRETMNEHPKQTIYLGQPTQADDGTMIPGQIQIDPGPTLMQKAAKATNGDRKAATRPQYWPLMKPCGNVGFFMPPTPSVIMSSSSLSPKFPHPVTVRTPTSYDIPCYLQPYLSDDNKSNIAQARDEELWEYEMTTFGVGPISDTQFQGIDREDNQRFLELAFDPERWMWTMEASKDIQHQQLTESAAQASEQTFETSVRTIEESLINVANEDAADPVTGNPAHKTIPQAIYMVQQMYKQVYIPMAILLLLPGAVMTQMKGMVKFGMMGEAKDEDAVSPFAGILRAIIAVFLIPATQLYVSYIIDIGNSMTYEVRRYITNELMFPEELFKYTREQTYNAPHENSQNVLEPDPYRPWSERPEQMEIRGDGIPTLQPHWDGKEYEMPEEDSEVEKQTQLSNMMQFGYNVMNFFMGQALVVLTGFQLVMMCYLLLMGPIAASLFAWPSGYGQQGLFRRVFSTWVDAITILGLWRFWWMVVLACMCVRIAWLKEMGWYTPNTQWEMMMFTCFMGLLMYVPFQPFEFKPGEVAAKVLEQGAQGAKQMGQSMGQMAGGNAQMKQMSEQMTNTGSMFEQASAAYSGASPSGEAIGNLGKLAAPPPAAQPAGNNLTQSNVLVNNTVVPPSGGQGNSPSMVAPAVAPPPSSHKGEPPQAAPRSSPTKAFPGFAGGQQNTIIVHAGGGGKKNENS
ncbi:MAG: hypothetical protein U0105_03045 [Candidatus Obscuribacterales bacterium]